MKSKRIKLLLLIAVGLLLTGCNMRTIEDMYQVPKRSDAYMSLQTVIDSVIPGYEYSAPLSGENLQTVQMADLDGDGVVEYLLFTKGTTYKPLKIFIFRSSDDAFVLLDTIESAGSDFDQVEYVQMDDKPGVEIVLGRKISDQVVRTMSVYTLMDGKIELVLNANYSKFLCCDLNSDSRKELMVFSPGADDSANGVVTLHRIQNDIVVRSTEVSMSQPVDHIKRIMTGRLDDGIPAVYVASDVDGNAIVTDIFALSAAKLTNLSIANEYGTSVNTLRNYYIYADDIDNDGVLELPSLILSGSSGNKNEKNGHHVIRWYAVTLNGTQITKKYTYHNIADGWYVELDSRIAEQVTVTQQGSSYEFYVWDEQTTASSKVMTIYVLTGQKREEQAQMDNRFVLHRTESTVYAANLSVYSAAYGMSQEGLIQSFHLILQDWKTGET